MGVKAALNAPGYSCDVLSDLGDKADREGARNICLTHTDKSVAFYLSNRLAVRRGYHPYLPTMPLASPHSTSILRKKKR